MPETQKIHSPDEMTPEYKKMVTQLLESQGVREFMAANIFSDALKFIPTLGLKELLAKQVVEELEHYEETIRLYRDLGGNLEAVVEERVQRYGGVPYIKSWFELWRYASFSTTGPANSTWRNIASAVTFPTPKSSARSWPKKKSTKALASASWSKPVAIRRIASRCNSSSTNGSPFHSPRLVGPARRATVSPSQSASKRGIAGQ